MVWSQLDVNKPHLVYIILGGFTSLFMLCSSVIKERLYIGEATVATLCGIIFGPHAANLIDPYTWGNTDQLTLEFSRIVLVVQCFAVGVELPKAYMERHWRSVVFLLIPVMTFGWLITSLFIWAMFSSHLSWLDSLCVAACVTATDPVLASSVVGKGKFAKRVPKHLRDLLSAESGCNDGMAFPFVYLGLYLIRYRPDAGKVTWHWIGITIFYECIFGAIYGVAVGYIARRAIRAAEERNLIDRESFLVFYFVLALFCAGSGSILGIDDLLVGFACGVGFSNDGWFMEKTEESHVSNVIDLLINLAFFVYFGTIIPWASYNSVIIGTSPWRLVVVALLVLFFRRIPIMLALKPLIPDIKTWREALFAGHFGPIGVGALFVAILARAELETDTTTPLAVLPEAGFPHLNIIELIWPITTFLVITSIIVHGSSIAVFTLGKHINTLTITMSYTHAKDEQSWMDRLPRIQSRSKTSMSMNRPGESEESLYDEKGPEYPAAILGLPRQFLRRQKESDDRSRSHSRSNSRSNSRQNSLRPVNRKRWDSGRGPGGPISADAITPQRRSSRPEDERDPERSESDTLAVEGEVSPQDEGDNSPQDGVDREGEDHKYYPEYKRQKHRPEVYEEGRDVIFEDEDGNVLEKMRSPGGEDEDLRRQHIEEEIQQIMSDDDVVPAAGSNIGKRRTRSPEPDERAEVGDVVDDINPDGAARHTKSKGVRGLLRRRNSNKEAPTKAPEAGRRHGPARAFRFGSTIIVEDEDGEVIKKYDIPPPAREKLERKPSYVDPQAARRQLQRMGTWLGISAETETGEGEASGSRPQTTRRGTSLFGVGRGGDNADEDNNDDDRVRFTVDGQTRRMSKAEFIRQIQALDPKSRAEVIEESDVPAEVKKEVRDDAADEGRKERKAGRDAPRGSVGKANGDHGEVDITKTSTNDETSGPEGLKLVDSNNEEIPFHSVSEDIFHLNRGVETAAQRRRRLASEVYTNVPAPQPAADRSEATSNRRRPVPKTNRSDEEETAAEKRRRLGALGVSREDSSSEDDDSTSSQAGPRAEGRSIMFADRAGRGGPSIKWGSNRGR